MNAQFKKILFECSDTSSPRGLKVSEALLTTIEINPEKPIIDYVVRPFNWKYFCGELCWYLMGNSDIQFISKFSKFWNALQDEDGNVNSNYGKILLRDSPQMKWVISNLLEDKYSRKAVVTINSSAFQYENNKDFPCTMYLNFFIRNNKLNMKVQMRSNDLFYGLTFDVPFFALLQQSVFLLLKNKYEDLELGTYYHCSDNSHFYEKHFELAKKIKDSTIEKDIIIKLKTPLFNEDGSVSNDSLSFNSNIISNLENIELFKAEDYKILLSKLIEIK